MLLHDYYDCVDSTVVGVELESSLDDVNKSPVVLWRSHEETTFEGVTETEKNKNFYSDFFLSEGGGRLTDCSNCQSACLWSTHHQRSAVGSCWLVLLPFDVSLLALVLLHFTFPSRVCTESI